MAEQEVCFERSDGVAVLTLNRPQRLNSFTPSMLEALGEHLREVASDPDVRVLVFTGAGRAFSAGQDLSVMAGASGDGFLERYYNPLVLALRQLAVPVIAAVNGVAAGAGLSLALACDLRLAAASARLVTAFEAVGLVPDTGLSYFLPRLVGLGRAMEWLLLGRTLSAAEALAAGLVNEVVADEAFEARWRELAGRLAAGPRGLGLTRQLLSRSLDRSLPEQLQEEARLQARALQTQDAREGLQAFLEKRRPVFRWS